MANKKIAGITVEIGGDTTQLGKALEDSEKQSKSLQSELKEIDRALKFNPDNVELLTQKQQLLTKQIDETTDALNTLKNAEKQVAEQFESGEIGEENYRAFQREIIETESKLKNYEKKLDETEDTLKKVSNAHETTSDKTDKFENELKEADKAAEDFEDSLEDIENAQQGFNDMMDKAAVGVAALGAAFVALGKEAIDAFNEVDEGADNVIKATGATGELAESLEESYTNVANSIVGDFATIGSALGEVNTRFGFTGEEAETATTKFLKFSEVTGMDAVSAVQEVAKAIQGAGLESSDYSDILDSLTTAAQVTGVSADTLAQSLVNNGAVMREMGYDVETTIGMLAQFEKAGVDSNSVIRGMRTAIAKWSKDGKDAKKEFERLVKGIKDGSIEAGEAYEVFGSKAGAELVDAIKSGRFEYEDMVKVIEDSQGALETTFDSTIDGGYELELAMQKTKVKMAELGDTILQKIIPIVNNQLLPGFEKFINYTVDNFDDILLLVQTLGTAFGVVFAVNKVSTFIESLKTLHSTFHALGVLLNAHPIGAAVTALGLAATAYAAISEATDRYMEKTYGLTDAEKELIAQIDARAESLKKANEERDKANRDIDTEIAQTQNLWAELQTIVDANGVIKKGYEDRAAVITGLLAESLGIEIKIIDGQIQKYDELKKSIDEVIRTKRAEALLDVNKDEYTTAIKNQADAFNEYNEALGNAAESKEKVAALTEELAELTEMQTAAFTIGDTYQGQALQTEILRVQEALDIATEAHNKNEDAVATSRDTYLNYANTIQNYEGLMAAVANGDVAQLNAAMDNLSNSFVTAENATKEMLENQLKDFQEQYVIMKEAVAAGMPGVSEEQVKQMGDLVTRAEAELNKLQPKATASGERAAKDFGAGIRSQRTLVLKDGQDVAATGDAGLGSANTKATGKAAVTGFAIGILDGKANTKKSGTDVAGSAKSGMASVSTKATGTEFAGQFTSGVLHMKDGAETSGKTLAKSGKAGLESVGTTSAGEDFGDGFGNGIDNKQGTIWEKAKSLAKSALNALKETLGINSPSKEARFLGEGFDEGFADGIHNERDQAVKEAENLADDALAALNKVNNVELGGFSNEFESGSRLFQRNVNISEKISNEDPKLYEALEKIYDRLDRMQIVLDSGTLVGETIDKIDAELASKQLLNARGV